MSRTSVTRTIDAPLERVFETIADIRNYSAAVPDIVGVELLSDVQTGVGTRFRETRLMRGRENSTELEVTEFVANEHVRIVTDAGGTIWDSVFRVRPVDGGTELNLTMDARAYRLRARLFNPLIRGMIEKALAADIEAVKRYCERDH